MSENLRAVFAESASEYLTELEESLLRLSEEPENTQEIDRIFRVMHTLKGSAAMVEFFEVSEFAHALETEFDFFRRGQAQVTQSLIKLTLKAHDIFMNLLEGNVVDEDSTVELLEKLKKERKKSQKSSDSKGPVEQAIDLIKEHKNHIEALNGKEVDLALSHKITHLISQLYYLSIKAELDNLSEFLSSFELFYRRMTSEGSAVSRELAQLTYEIVQESNQMLTSSLEEDEMDMDPEKIMSAMQRPLELKDRFNKIAESIKFSDAALPARNEYIISIDLGKSLAGQPFTSQKDYEQALERLGNLQILDQSKGQDS